jgi:hypothetical protein
MNGGKDFAFAGIEVLGFWVSPNCVVCSYVCIGRKNKANRTLSRVGLSPGWIYFNVPPGLIGSVRLVERNSRLSIYVWEGTKGQFIILRVINWKLTSVLRYLLPIDSTWIFQSIYPLCLFSFNFLYYSLFFSNSVEQTSAETVDFAASAFPCLCLAWELVAVFSTIYHWALSWNAWIHFTPSFYVECKPISVYVPALLHSLQQTICSRESACVCIRQVHGSSLCWDYYLDRIFAIVHSLYKKKILTQILP